MTGFVVQSHIWLTNMHCILFIFKTVWSRLMDNVYEIQVHES